VNRRILTNKTKKLKIKIAESSRISSGSSERQNSEQAASHNEKELISSVLINGQANKQTSEQTKFNSSKFQCRSSAANFLISINFVFTKARQSRI
jgi:hypothetical protein